MVRLTLSNKECILFISNKNSHHFLSFQWITNCTCLYCLFISCVTVYEVSWFILNFYRFLHELAQIPNFAERAQCIIFRSVFSEGITALHRKVEIITRASKVCLLPNSRMTLPFLEVEEEVESGKDQLESLCRKLFALRLCISLWWLSHKFVCM